METNFKSINFGISRLSREEPGYPWVERIKEIPVNEIIPEHNKKDFEYLLFEIKDFVPKRLPKKNFIKDYSDVRNRQYAELPAITLDLIAKPESNPQSANLYLIWIEERKEWVSFVHRGWYETAHGEDESEDGPYSLNSYCINLICEAYKIDVQNIKDFQEITRKSPSELEEIARNIS